MGYKFNPFTGNLDEVGAGGGGATSPGGSTTQLQFNDAGSFGGDVDLTWNKTTNVLGITGDVNLNDGGTYTTTVQCVTPTANRTISFPDATGTVALVAGSSGQIIYNNAGAYAGVSTMTFDGTSVTLAGRLINSYTSLASSPAKVFTGTWFTGGTATTTKPHFLVEPAGTTSTAWSTSGTGLGVNAASGFAGNLLDLQVNGTRQLSVSNSGSISLAADSGISASTAGLVISGGGANNITYRFAIGTGGNQNYSLHCGDGNTATGSYLFWSAAGPSTALTQTSGTSSVVSLFSGGLKLSNSAAIRWSSTSNAGRESVNPSDLLIFRDAANTLAQRNDTNAQTFRVYNTYTSSTNYELGKLEWSSNVFRIGTEKGSGGGTARTLEVHTDSISRLALDTTGSVRVVTGLTVATLPGTPAVGMIARVTDATAPAVGSTVTGGGAANALCWYNGSNWTVLGV